METTIAKMSIVVIETGNIEDVELNTAKCIVASSVVKQENEVICRSL